MCNDLPGRRCWVALDMKIEPTSRPVDGHLSARALSQAESSFKANEFETGFTHAQFSSAASGLASAELISEMLEAVKTLTAEVERLRGDVQRVDSSVARNYLSQPVLVRGIVGSFQGEPSKTNPPFRH